jgi:hypothetical protein
VSIFIYLLLIYLYRILILGIDPAAAATDLQAIWQPNEIWSQFIDCFLRDGYVSVSRVIRGGERLTRLLAWLANNSLGVDGRGRSGVMGHG